MNEWTPYDFSFLTACEPTRLAVMRANCEKEITAYEASLVKTEKLLQAIQAEQDLRSAYGVKPRVTASRSPEHRTLLSLGALTRLLRAAEGGNSRAQAYWNRCAVAYTSLTDDEQSKSADLIVRAVEKSMTDERVVAVTRMMIEKRAATEPVEVVLPKGVRKLTAVEQRTIAERIERTAPTERD